MWCRFQFLYQNLGTYTDSIFHCLQLTSRLLPSSNGHCNCFCRIHSLEGNAARRRVERGLFNTRGGRFQRPSSWYVVLEGSPSPVCAPSGCHSEILPFPKLDTPSSSASAQLVFDGTWCVRLHPPRQVCLHTHLHVPTSKAWQTTCRSNVCEKVSERRCKYSLIT